MISTDLSHSIKTGTTSSRRRVAANKDASAEPGILITGFSHVFASLRMVAPPTTTLQSVFPNNDRHAQTAMSLKHSRLSSSPSNLRSSSLQPSRSLSYPKLLHQSSVFTRVWLLASSDSHSAQVFSPFLLRHWYAPGARPRFQSFYRILLPTNAFTNELPREYHNDMSSLWLRSTRLTRFSPYLHAFFTVTTVQITCDQVINFTFTKIRLFFSVF